MLNYNNESILIVDDTPENLDVLGGILSNYKRYFATNGKQAIERANSILPDLILLDIMMPEMDGYEICRQLKSNEKTCDIPIIFITAKTEDNDELVGFEAGGADFISKPINPLKIKARVKTHLALKKATDNLKKQNKLLIEHQQLLEDVDRISRHDLKTPLNSIINAPECIRIAGIINEQQEEFLTMIEDSGYRILTMINNSLDLYKMETGKYEFNPLPIDIIALINRIIYKEFSSYSKNYNINIHIKFDEKPLCKNDSFIILGCELLCYSMMSNIIKNAVEAQHIDDVINILLYNNNEMAEIHVQNSKVVPDEIKNTFFDKYVSYGKKSGTGLGTYSAKLMAETQGGSIEMKSSDDIGTIVIIKLPKSD